MHPFVIQELARQHQESLVREATSECMSRHVHKKTKQVSMQSVVLQQKPLSEPDFAAIRRDLRSTLSEWCLESRTANSEAAIDTFIQHLRIRLGYNEVVQGDKGSLLRRLHRPIRP